MESGIFGYIQKFSKAQQVLILLLTACSFPFLYLSYQVPKEIIDKIYEPYVTSKKAGTGLGLAIVYKIIEEHSGIIEIKNTKPSGVCIIITLPVEDHKIG